MNLPNIVWVQETPKGTLIIASRYYGAPTPYGLVLMREDGVPDALAPISEIPSANQYWCWSEKRFVD